MPIEPGASYVFDLDRTQCRIVTRFKSNTPLAAVEELPVPPATRTRTHYRGFLLRNPLNIAAAQHQVSQYVRPVNWPGLPEALGLRPRALCVRREFSVSCQIGRSPTHPARARPIGRQVREGLRRASQTLEISLTDMLVEESTPSEYRRVFAEIAHDPP